MSIENCSEILLFFECRTTLRFLYKRGIPESVPGSNLIFWRKRNSNIFISDRNL